MKKRNNLLKIMSLAAACMLAINLSAQTEPALSSYRFGGGILIDVGDGGTMVGPHVKYFFDSKNAGEAALDRKSTRLNSSHDRISYAVFCLKKKKKKQITFPITGEIPYYLLQLIS